MDVVLLPAGTLRYLKDQPDGIVAVVLVFICNGALVAGAPAWPSVTTLFISYGLYHVRRSGAERHAGALAEQKVEKAQADVERIKARHRERQLQPQLPLGSVSQSAVVDTKMKGMEGSEA